MSVRWREDRQMYEASFMDRGRRRRVLREKKKDAEEVERLAKLKQLDLREEIARIPISDAFRSYFEDKSSDKTSRANDRQYFNLANHFLTAVRGIEFLDEISLQDLEALQKWLLKEQVLEEGNVKSAWKASSVNRAFHTFKNFFTTFSAWGKIQKNPAEHLKALSEQSVTRLPVTKEIFDKVMGISPAWFQDVLTFLYGTGARGSSVERLIWEGGVNFAERWIKITSKKGANAQSKEILLPMTDSMFALLIKVRNKWPLATGAVFRYDNGQPVKADRISKVGCRLIKEAGFPDVDLICARHALASELTDAGVPTEVVRQLLGHASIKTTQNYAKGTNMETLARSLTVVRGTQNVPPNATGVKPKVAVGSGDSE